MNFGLRAGVAKVDITPPVGMAMAGYGARERPCEGILDPLCAYAIALEQGDTACGLVVSDLRILLHQGKTPDARESLRRAPDAVLGSLLNHGLSP